MDSDAFRGLRAKLEHRKSKPCKKGDTREKCRRRRDRYYSPFAVLFPASMGTPRTAPMGTSNGDGDAGGDMGGGDSMPSTGESMVRPSKARVFHEMKRSMGLLEYFSDHSWGSGASGAAVDPGWGGYSVPQLGMIKMRKGGPIIGGPGFTYNVDGEEDGKGGIYDFKKSPGLGFRTEYGWRVWMAALEVMERDARGTKQQIMMKAMGRAGVSRGQMDASEMRLVEMGIEWYLSDPGALAAKRGSSFAPGSGPGPGGGNPGGGVP